MCFDKLCKDDCNKMKMDDLDGEIVQKLNALEDRRCEKKNIYIRMCE